MITCSEHIDPVGIICEIYDHSRTAEILIAHGRQVADKALALADRLAPLSVDRCFIEQAALLHDIGVGVTDAPSIGCHGKLPYVCHGVAGRKLLDQRGLTAHGRVCETHVGAGLSADEIRRRGLPLPIRDMLPQSLEEQLICYADKFFSKKYQAGGPEKSMDAIINGLARYGDGQLARFQHWVARFEPERG